MNDSADILDITLECIYSKLIFATIDHQKSLITVSKTMGRDVSSEEVLEMLDKLESWVSSISDVETLYSSMITELNQNVEDSRPQFKKKEEEDGTLISGLSEAASKMI